MITFKKPLMHSGEPHPSRWHSDNNVYAIAEYHYASDGARGMVPCDPYYCGYIRESGTRITARYGCSFLDVAQIITNHNEVREEQERCDQIQYRHAQVINS